MRELCLSPNPGSDIRLHENGIEEAAAETSHCDENFPADKSCHEIQMEWLQNSLFQQFDDPVILVFSTCHYTIVFGFAR